MNNEDKKYKIDLMHYKNNRLSFWVIMLAIALNIAMFLIIYKTTECTSNVQLGIDLLINITVMLACFLAAEKTKRYSKEWGIVSIVLGGIQIARIFWIPLYYFLAFLSSGSGLNVIKFVFCLILLLLSGLSLAFAGIVTIKKQSILSVNKPLLEIEGEKKDVRT